MYSFLFDPAYMTLFVIALLIFLVMFLWRKLTILEGNFFILEKRVNLIKKESRETSLAKNLERSNIVMNEIFNDATCKPVGTCSFPLKDNDTPTDVSVTATSVTIVTHDHDKAEIDQEHRDDDNVKISFTNNNDIDKKIEDAIDPVDIINAIDKISDIENDNMSIASEFTLSDDKISQKKLAKMNVDKLKGICTQLNVSPEGTKAQLISRILESNK